MSVSESELKEILIRENYISAEDLKRAEEFSNTHHTNILTYLISENLITKNLLGQALAERYKMPYADFSVFKSNSELLKNLPEDMAQKYRIVVLGQDNSLVKIATDTPDQPSLIEKLQEIFPNSSIQLFYALTDDIDSSLQYYKKPLSDRFQNLVRSQDKFAPEAIKDIIEDAVSIKASDIHFEPQEKEVIIRFRIDGVLKEVERISKSYYEEILNRIKVQAKLRIDEHFSAQDGAFRTISGKDNVDLRVSIIPTLDGEKIVIRVLSVYVREFTMNDLGFSSQNQELLIASAKKPYGMILVSGPTGSGKTTSLYSLIKLLNGPDINITTIEDPVEYKIAGVNQIQVNPETNLTFSAGLKSIIRQDPDIILVGEIRDRETAEIAVNAALTGHLLLSSFHANEAATVIPRILDIGVEPFLLSSTLELIVAQRLVRRLCRKCRFSYFYQISDLVKILPTAADYFGNEGATLYRSKGCNVCNQSGFSGRTAIFEIIKASKEIKQLILTRPTADQVWQLAKSQGSKSIFDDGIEKVIKGDTVLEELMRVAPPSH